MVPVLGREVEEGQQGLAVFGQAGTALGYFAPYFSSKTVIAVSAAARVGAPWISRKSSFIAAWTDLGTLLSTLAVL